MNSHAKWLRQAAEEIAKAGHNGWGNTCLQAADEIATLTAKVAELEAKVWQLLDAQARGVVMSSDKTGTWNYMQELKAMIGWQAPADGTTAGAQHE